LVEAVNYKERSRFPLSNFALVVNPNLRLATKAKACKGAGQE